MYIYIYIYIYTHTYFPAETGTTFLSEQSCRPNTRSLEFQGKVFDSR